jgi:hypothetical protein
VEDLDNMKLRLILMGCILTAIGILLLVVRGYSVSFVGIIGVGILLAAVGVVWKPRKKAGSIQRDTD